MIFYFWEDKLQDVKCLMVFFGTSSTKAISDDKRLHFMMLNVRSLKAQNIEDAELYMLTPSCKRADSCSGNRLY
jgi:hypothetical protein